MAIQSLQDKRAFRSLGAEIEAELKELAVRHGIQIAYTGGMLGMNKATMKLDISLVRTDGKSPEALAFEQSAHILGFEPSDLYRKFVFRRKEYKIVGAKMTARKNPILAEEVATGRTYIFNEDDVLPLIGKKSSWERRGLTLRPITPVDLDREARDEMRAEARMS